MDPAKKMYLTLTGKSEDDRTRKDRALKFPLKLMYALQCGDYDDIIVWYPNGEAFVVVDPKAFEQRVLPDIFKEAKFSSFDRKLKRWGFERTKVHRGNKACCYGHPKFRRGNFNLCNSMSLPNGNNPRREVVNALLPIPDYVLGIGQTPLDLICNNPPSTRGVAELTTNSAIPQIPTVDAASALIRDSHAIVEESMRASVINNYLRNSQLGNLQPSQLSRELTTNSAISQIPIVDAASALIRDSHAIVEESMRASVINNYLTNSQLGNLQPSQLSREPMANAQLAAAYDRIQAARMTACDINDRNRSAINSNIALNASLNMARNVGSLEIRNNHQQRQDEIIREAYLAILNSRRSGI